MMQVCTTVCGQTCSTTSGRPLSPSQTRKNTSRTPRRLRPGTDTDIRGLPTGLGLVFQVAEMLGQFLVERGFQHVLGEQLQQPVRAGQLQPMCLGSGHHGRRGGLLGRQLPSRLVVTLAWAHNVACHYSQCPSRRTSARRVGPKHR